MTAAVRRDARIGPNAIVRTLEAVRERCGTAAADLVFHRAGLEGYLRDAPAAMVPEADVIQLYAAMRAQLGPGEARSSAYLAGRKTGDYLLAHRIPRAVRVLLGLLPPRLAAPPLLAAIGKHSWTFAGSGIVRTRAGPPVTIAIEQCPMCRDVVGEGPACAFYAGTFERLFRELVAARASVAEVACGATGAPRCVFEIRW